MGVLGAPLGKITLAMRERYVRNYGNVTPAGHAMFAPEDHAEVNYVGVKRVPRLFKAGLAYWSSPQNSGAPYSQSSPAIGGMMALTPHIVPRTLARSTSRAVGTSAVLRPASSGRIAPVLVPRARFAR